MPSTDRQHAFLAGVRACIPLAPGVLLFGMVCGAAAAAAGLTPGQSFALSWLVFAGSSQIVATQLFVADAPGWVIVLTGWIVNLRFMMYSATLAQQFRGESRRSRWLAGGPSPESGPESGADGAGKVPNLTPHANGLAEWSERQIARYLKTGFTPDYDTVGGSMVKVQENLARLSDSDREAIAAYLKAVPPVP